MAGKIKMMIDSVIEQRAKGDEILKKLIVIKLMLKGIDPRKYTDQSDDDPEVIGKLEALLKDLK